MSDLWFFLILVTTTFLVAGFVKGVIGLGLPTVAVGLLGLVMTPGEAATLLVVPSLVTNLWQLLAGPRFGGLARRLWPMLLAICLGTWAGSGLLTHGPAGRATAALGLALALYALLGLTRLQLRVSAQWERPLSPLIGAATGLVTAATGVFVLPAVPYVQALGFDKDGLIQALGLSFTVSTLALAAGLGHDGAFDAATIVRSALAVLPALAGMGIGQWVRRRVRPTLFRTCFFAGLLALGADLMLRGL
ncbi:membrane protein [Aliidongia dinghuensis]|uniref:Probable membrane transporter protein n=1 Tax=Aliidongia dinghuensis TaxID=1867774 RepID=A0A8J3E704_9PROT|nr:sulfite exporter TauE/SafE family protein [Aliidongia dinghuensis]GGF50007.1 membrane protein [Aliidongia dinghuensis]